MNTVLLFLAILAWVFAPLSFIIGSLHVHWSNQYPGSLEQSIDRLGGYRKVFQPGRWLLISIICWAYLGAYYFG